MRVYVYENSDTYEDYETIYVIAKSKLQADKKVDDINVAIDKNKKYFSYKTSIKINDGGITVFGNSWIFNEVNT